MLPPLVLFVSLVLPELVEVVVELLPVPAPEVEGVPEVLEVTAVVPVAAVLAAPEPVLLAGLLCTNCVSAVSRALNSLPPPCVELVLAPVEPKSEPPPWCRLPDAR